MSGRNLLGGNWKPKEREKAAAPAPQAPTPAPASASLSLLASFSRGDLSSADGSTAMKRVASQAADADIGLQLPSAKCMTGGWIFDVTIRVDGGDSGGTHWQVEVYVNGTATGIIKRLAGTTFSDQSTVARYPLAPGDVITCVDSKSGAVNAQEGFADVWGRLEGLPGAAGV